MEPPLDEQKTTEGSPIIRWSVSIFCIVLITMVVYALVVDLLLNNETIEFKRITGYLVILLIGILSLGAIWRISIAARLLAGLMGIFGLQYLIDEWMISSEPILDAKRYASASNPLNAVLYFLLIAVPCLLYASGGSRFLKKYLLPGCLIFFLYLLGSLAYALSKLSHWNGWQYLLLILPIILGIMWLILQGLRDDFRERKRGWRVVFHEDGSVTYQERVGRLWISILLRCEQEDLESATILMLPGRNEWKQFPTWTEERHPIIMERITESLDADDYTLIDPDTMQAIERSSTPEDFEG